MLICIRCRDANPIINEDRRCTVCFRDLKVTPRNWAPPKKNNLRAWKRISEGEWLWDRRRVRRKKRDTRDTKTYHEIVKVPIEQTEESDCSHSCCNLFPRSQFRYERVPGSQTEVTNWNRSPDVELGG